MNSLKEKEEKMYPFVKKWLETYLKKTYKNCHVEVVDSHLLSLDSVIRMYKFDNFIKAYQTYKIKIDIAGFIVKPNKEVEIVLVECKSKNISLKDLSQIIGYTLIVKPVISIIVGTGINRSIMELLQIYNRRDVIQYKISSKTRTKEIKFAKFYWDNHKIEFINL